MSQATDIYLIESLWPDLKVKRQLGSGLFGSVYEVRTNDQAAVDLSPRDGSQQLAGSSREDLSLEAAVQVAGHPMSGPERYAIRVLTLPRNMAASKELARDLNLTRTQDLAAYYKDLVQDIQEEIRQLQNLQFDSPFLEILDYKALKQLQGPGWHILIRTEYLPSLSGYQPLEESLLALRDSKSEGQAKLNSYVADWEAFTPSQALALSRDIGEALDALHAHGMAYGPLLPSRVFRQSDHAYKLGGLPLAGLTGSALARTGVGSWPASVKIYLAPELADGYPPSPASDILALGLLILQVLSPEDFQAYIQKKISEPLDPAPDQLIRPSMPRLEATSPDFAQVLLKAIAPDAKDRYSDLASFQQDLQALGQSLESYVDNQQKQTAASPDPKGKTLEGRELADQGNVESGSNRVFQGDKEVEPDQVYAEGKAKSFLTAAQTHVPKDSLTHADIAAEDQEEANQAEFWPEVYPAAQTKDAEVWPDESSSEQIWDAEDYPGDEPGFYSADLAALDNANPGSDNYDNYLDRELDGENQADFSGKAEPDNYLPEPDSQRGSKTRQEATSESYQSKLKQDKPKQYKPQLNESKQQKPKQQKWRLPLLIVLCIIAFAAIIYFGHIFLQSRQTQDVAPKQPTEQATQQTEHSATNPDQSASSQPANASSSNADQAQDFTEKASSPSAKTEKDQMREANSSPEAEKGQLQDRQLAAPQSPAQAVKNFKGSMAQLDQLVTTLAQPAQQLKLARNHLNTQLVQAWQTLLASSPAPTDQDETATDTASEVAASEKGKSGTEIEESGHATDASESETEGPEAETEDLESAAKPSEDSSRPEAATEESVTEREQAASSESSQTGQGSGTSYVVQPGDILYGILYKHYGAYEEVVDRVLAVNPQIENIDNLPAGLEIFLPDLD